ncbi:MAG: 2-enoyl thioester reductase domain-containing protein [Rhodospirillales bacterium]|nr:MAG: 2-enoyl thioester reductase domain-containing protein [Rhodospirillales bacterium]
MKAIEFATHGVPHEVCRCVEIADVGPPSAGEIVVEILASAINPADLLIIEGRYPGPDSLPARLGIEGVGRVVEIGENVDSLSIGDIVVSLERQNWAQRIRIPANRAIRIAEDVDPLQLAQLKANPPSAMLMLRNYVDLKPGDWVVQNAANSGVGRHVVRLATAQGIRTANIVRRPEAVAPLKDIGAEIVLVDGDDVAARMRAETGGAGARLALDAVCGEATQRLADCLDDGGVIVNYGFLSGEPCMVTPHQLILRDITLKGFWMVKAGGGMSPDAMRAMYQELASRFADGTLFVPVDEVFELDAIAEALERSWRFRRSGKIVLTPNGPID